MTIIDNNIKSPLLRLSMIFLTFNIFFGYIALIQSDITFLFIGFIFLLIWNLSASRTFFKLSTNNFLWFICAITFCVSSFYAVDIFKSLKFSAIFSLVIIMKIILENSIQWIKYYK
ncbi:hypothetical protein, partial [Paenibacillus sp.]|uniref:hypothetical protein n=1 Tax=Paenibacillus sp. TaxID=58172 RepID=UPI0028AFECFE